MKERPIIFSGAMVRAILDGRKTQTRRVVRWPKWADPDRDWPFLLPPAHSLALYRDGRPVKKMGCPYGVPGDRLWVRETWRVTSESNHYDTDEKRLYVAYRANTGSPGHLGGRQHTTIFSASSDEDLAAKAWGNHRSGPWRPSIHMPRWASRLMLEVTAVRVERLQDISEADAAAEGVDGLVPGHGPVTDAEVRAEPGYMRSRFYRDGFAFAWHNINGKRPGCSWEDNPWVWVVSVRRLEG